MYIPSGSELLNPISLLEKAGVREGMKVADLGCGSSGHFVFPAARMIGKEGRAYAVDILKSALAGVESRMKLEGLRNVKIVWSDLEVPGGTKITEGSLDLAMLINNRARDAMIREAVRLVKLGGKLLIVDWKLTQIPFGPPSAERVSPEETRVTAEKYGMKLQEKFEAGKYHWGLIFTKA